MESLECSLPLEAGHQIFKISSYDPSFGIEVTHVSDQTLEMNELAVNSKGCFTLSKELKGHLVLRGLDKTELLGAVYPLPHSDGTRSIEKLALSRVQPSNIYPKLCEDKPIQYTSSNHFDFAIPSSLITADHFYVIESQSHGRSLRKVFTSSLNNQVGLLSVDELKDGKNDLMFNVFDLLQSKKVLREESCSVFVDTVNPSVVVKRSDGNSVVEADSVFAPGERIYLNGEEGIKLNYCLHQTDGVVEDQCSEFVGSGFITLPQGGRWTLRTTVTDLAGNSHTESLALRVYNDSAVKLIRAQAITNIAGASSSSLKKAADLERERLALYGKYERDELETETKIAMLSALSRNHKLSVKAYECSPQRVVPLLTTIDRIVLLSWDENFFCVYKLDGTLEFKTDNRREEYGFPRSGRIINSIRAWKSHHLVRYLAGKFSFIDLTNGDVKTVDVPRSIREFDIDPIKGTIYALDSSTSVFHKIDFDGKSHTEVEIKVPSHRVFDSVTYLPFESGPRLFIQNQEFSNIDDQYLLCDLSLSHCSRDINFAKTDRLYLSSDNKWMTVVQGFGTKIWSLNDTLPLSTDQAIIVQGRFVRFLDDNRYLTDGLKSWEVWKINEDRSVQREYQGEKADNESFISLTFNEFGATIFHSKSISQWQNSEYQGLSRLIDSLPFEDSGALFYVSPGKDRGEYILFSYDGISTFRLGCLCRFELFKDGSSALQSIDKSVVYSNTEGKLITFTGELVGMSPQKNFAIIQQISDDRSKGRFIWQLLDKKGNIVTSVYADGHHGDISSSILAAKDETILMAMDSRGDYKIFETGVKYSSYNLHFEVEPQRDVFLTSINGIVIWEYKDGIEIYNYEKNFKRIIPNSSLAYVGKIFPFILYENYNQEDEKVIVLEDFESGRRFEWPFQKVATLISKIEKCGAFFVRLKESTNSSQLVDLRTFESYKFDSIEDAECSGLIPRLTLSRGNSNIRGTDSFIVDKSFQISPAIPYRLLPLGLNRYYGRESEGKTTQLYDEAGTFIRSHSMEGKEFRGSYGAYFPEGYVFLFADQALLRAFQTTTTLRTALDAPTGLGAGISFRTAAGLFQFVYSVGRSQFYNQSFGLSNSKIHFGLTSRF
ncbi:MAG: hypothetical protein EOP04_07445 [Proteobacteria bacterium]|nr:MAG: hypothetical protein EOP04_07445 [Pseudomonadota bacterium]